MKLTDIKNSINEISAIGGLKQVVKGNTDRVEGIKLSKEMAQAMIDWFNSSPYGRKYPKAAKARLHLSLGIMSNMGLDRYAKHKGAKEELKYIKDLSKAMRDNVNESTLNERADESLTDKEQELVRKSLQRAAGVSVATDVTDLRYNTGTSEFIFDGGEEMMLYVGYDEDDEEYNVSIESFDDGQIAQKNTKDLKSAIKVAMQMAKKYKKRLTSEVELNERDDAGTHLDKLADLVGKAKDFFAIGKELDKGGYKKKYSYSSTMMPMYQIEIDGFKFGIINKKYVDKGDREVGSTQLV